MFSPSGQEEVYTTLEETFVLDSAVTYCLDYFNCILFCVIVQVDQDKHIENTREQTGGLEGSRTFKSIFVHVQNQIPHPSGTNFWEVEHLSHLVCVVILSLQQRVEHKNGRGMTGTAFFHGRK